MKFFRNKLTKYALTLSIVGLVFYFFANALVDNWQALRNINFYPDLWSLMAVVVFAAAVVASGWLWGMIVNALSDKKVLPGSAVKVHITSWLLKYVPGQVGSVANKIAWGHANGYSKKVMLASFIYENIFLQVASFALAVPILLVASGPAPIASNWLYLVAPLAMLAVILIVSNQKIFYFVTSRVLKSLFKKNVTKELFLPSKEVLRLQLAFLVPRLINSLGFVLILISFFEISPNTYLPLAAAYVFAGAIGILAVFVPSGLGVREAVIVLFSAQFMPIEQAIVAAAIARLYSTFADGLLALWYLISKFKYKKEASE